MAKNVHNLPEDDNRMPNTIADFIGDNVNDIAGINATMQYQMGKITESQVRNFAPRWISWEQVEEILGGETVGL